MGTSTIFRRLNDLKRPLASMSKEELEKIDKLNPWSPQVDYVGGWDVQMELHNGNFHPLIWWYGGLLHLKDAPRKLDKMPYNRLTGKYTRVSEWTLLKKYLDAELNRLDKEYKKFKRKEYRNKKKK